MAKQDSYLPSSRRRSRPAGLATAMLVALAVPAFAQNTSLVGKLEAPEISNEAATFPKAFKEAPMLAELVKAGKLPPVAERLPQDVQVVKPLRSAGTYGGTWRRGFIGPSDVENGNRIRAGDKPLFFDLTATKPVPNLLRGFEMSADGKRTTLLLRRGLKWSDGSPFTAEDFRFWYEDMYQNKDLVAAPAEELRVDGKPARFTVVDKHTVAFEFDQPNFLFPQLLAGDNFVGGGQSRHQSQGRSYGLYAPAHYLKQFLPKHTAADQLNAQAKAAGYENWVQLFKFKSDWSLNVDVPTVSAYRMTKPINSQTLVLERNPYFYEVDTAGNQLPYIDTIQMTLAENAEVANLRAVAGEYDYQERHMDLSKLPTFIENAQRGNYKVHLDLGYNGSDTSLIFTMGYDKDPEIGKWIANADFRRALSLGIDRDQINEAFFLGLGTPGSVVPAESSPHNPGPDWRKKWSVHDVKQANAMLDRIGLSKRDGDNFRVRTDNGERLRLTIDVAPGLLPTWPQQAEMITQQWKDIGIWADIKVLERNLSNLRRRNDEAQISISGNTGTEDIFVYPVGALPVRADQGWMGFGYSLWYQSNGAEGKKPTEPELLEALDLLRGGAALTDEQRSKAARRIWELAVNQQWAIGVVGQSPAYMGIRVVNNRLQNVPQQTCTSQQCRTPWSARPEQWYFK